MLCLVFVILVSSSYAAAKCTCTCSTATTAHSTTTTITTITTSNTTTTTTTTTKSSSTTKSTPTSTTTTPTTSTTAATTPLPFLWSDCGTNKRGVHFNYLSVSPNPIVFPGNVTVSANITIDRSITSVFVDVSLRKRTAFGPYLEVSCGYMIAPRLLCHPNDVCSFLNDAWNDTSLAMSNYIGKQIQTIIVSALGSQSRCPIQPGAIIVASETIQLHALPIEISSVAAGYYNARLTLLETPTSTDNVGCLDLHVGIERAFNGFLFG